MGWMFSRKPKDVAATEFLKSRIECDNEHGTWRVLESHVTLRVGYFAVERLVKATGESYVFAAVFLIQYRPKDIYNFGYKDMDESCGPGEDDCPAKILNILSPTDNEWGLNWRERCREKIRKKKIRNKLLRDGSIAPGDIIEFSTPFSFFGCGTRSIFRVDDIKKGIFSDPDRKWMLYKLRGWRNHDFTVVSKATASQNAPR